MRKQEKRAVICLIMALMLVAGLGIFGYRLVKHGVNGRPSTAIHRYILTEPSTAAPSPTETE